jgi:hypothetical protein
VHLQSIFAQYQAAANSQHAHTEKEKEKEKGSGLIFEQSQGNSPILT